ncbi:MAG: family 43 glycosylhydrolase, partial [Chitinophagaceae bacterium]
MTLIFVALLFSLMPFARASAQPMALGTVVPTRQTPVHDPVMIREGNTYYLFCTGNGITVFSSTDMENWQKRKPVFDAPPKWAQAAIKGFRGSIWAPDIHFYEGMYYLYYAVSAF